MNGLHTLRSFTTIIVATIGSFSVSSSAVERATSTTRARTSSTTASTDSSMNSPDSPTDSPTTAPVDRRVETGSAVTTRAAAVELLSNVRRFSYQLQKLRVDEAAASAADLFVVDPHGDDTPLTRDDVNKLSRLPGGRRRLVLAYLSIGEAEDYRDYWKKEWSKKPPPWLGPVNPNWPGNFEVKYWDPAWQAVILGHADAPLDKIVSDGFDGVYLDIVDGFEYWEEHGNHTAAREQMIEWVTKIAAYARKDRPGFLVVPQNGEALGDSKDYLKVIDAIGREDLIFNGDKRQKSADRNEVIAMLDKFVKAKKPVFLIEYCRKQANVETVHERAATLGYIPLIAPRNLDRLTVTTAGREQPDK